MSGWTLLDRLKHDSRTAHIPVHILSGHENNKRGFALGAMTCMPKDASQGSQDAIFDVIQRSMERRRKTLVLVAENEVRTADISNLLSGDDLEILHVSDLTSAGTIVNARQVDAIVLDCVPETAGLEFIESVQARSPLQVPAIVVSGSQRLSDQQVAEIHHCARVGPFDTLPPSNVCWKNPFFCCIAKKSSSHRISGARLRKSGNPTRCWWAEKCWSLMTTFGISSP